VDYVYWLLGLTLVLVAFSAFTIVQRLDLILRQLVLLQRKADLALTHLGIQPPPYHSPLSERVKELAADPQRKIEAIKVYREETGAGLKDAKDAIEKWRQEKGL
jgi:ribosomal protein L7/L12